MFLSFHLVTVHVPNLTGIFQRIQIGVVVKERDRERADERKE